MCDRFQYKTPHFPLVAKTYLPLRGMHIHIHRPRINLQKKKCRWVAAFLNASMVGVQHRKAQRPAVDRSAVHHRYQFPPRAPSDPRFRGQARQAQPFLRILRIHWNEIVHQTATPDFPNAISQCLTGGRLKHNPPVFRQAKGELRMGEGDQAAIVGDVRGFGAGGLQEFAPRRHRVKELRHLDDRPDRHPAILPVKELPTVHRDFRAVFRTRLPRPQNEARYRGNRRQGLPPKSETRDRVEVGGLPNLTGGVPFQREQRRVRCHPTTIVLHPNIGFSAFAKFHFHPRCARINTVLYQFLYHRNRAFNHLARRDLIGNPIR